MRGSVFDAAWALFLASRSPKTAVTLAVRLKEAWHCDCASALGEVHAMGCHRALAKAGYCYRWIGCGHAQRCPSVSVGVCEQRSAFRGIAGGVLWLVSSPQYGKYRLPPSLVARLQIKDVVADHDSVAEEIDPDVRRAGRWIALADRDRSAYLPLNNALDVLCNLRFRGRHSGPIRLKPAAADSGPPSGLYSRLPGYFQRHRIVDPDSVPALEEYAHAVQRADRRLCA